MSGYDLLLQLTVQLVPAEGTAGGRASNLMLLFMDVQEYFVVIPVQKTASPFLIFTGQMVLLCRYFL